MAAHANELAVRVRGLRKRYGDVTAVDGIDLGVRRGEVFGLLGPDGAGKSTTVEILQGNRSRDTGEVSVPGADPASGTRAWRSRAGIVRQDESAPAELTVHETVRHFALHCPRPRSPREVIGLVGPEAKADSRIKALPDGQRRRPDMAPGVIGNPELLLPDEPSTGFGPAAGRQFRDLIRLPADAGTMILLGEPVGLRERHGTGATVEWTEHDRSTRAEHTDTPTRTAAVRLPGARPLGLHRGALEIRPPTAYFPGKIWLVLFTGVLETAILLLVGTTLYGIALPSDAGRWFDFAWLFALGLTGRAPARSSYCRSWSSSSSPASASPSTPSPAAGGGRVRRRRDRAPALHRRVDGADPSPPGLREVEGRRPDGRGHQRDAPRPAGPRVCSRRRTGFTRTGRGRAPSDSSGLPDGNLSAVPPRLEKSMSQENPVEADPTTDADEALLDRVLASAGTATGSEHAESTSEARPARGSAAPARHDGRPAARRQPESE